MDDNRRAVTEKGPEKKIVSIHRLTETRVPAREETVILACDVAMEWITVYSEMGGEKRFRKTANTTAAIKRFLMNQLVEAVQSGATEIMVVAEPTGCYHETLMRMAGRLGMQTAWVSGEAVAKFRVIESNDTGKTDEKDPRVIHSLSKLKKTLKHRILEGPYELLRDWNKIYDDANLGVVRAKTAIHSVLKRLFPDFGFGSDFLFGRTGQALVRGYGANPYRMVRAGEKRMAKKLKTMAPRIRKDDIKRLYDNANKSVDNKLDARLVRLLEYQLGQQWADWQRYHQRKLEARKKMQQLYAEARQQDPHLPQGVKGVISDFSLARIVGETGPLSDFSHWRQILRFAGFNIRERKSGRYRGLNKISKKGRSELRAIMSKTVLRLVKKKALFGSYYHGKKDGRKERNGIAMTAVCRKMLKLLWGWYRSASAFDETRVFNCENQMKKAA